MGHVYRARDKVLGREVALKILPDAVAGDRERLARFEREARTLAALNHPTIAQVFDAAGRSASGDGEPGLAHARVSPDGRWMSYSSTESGTGEVYLRPFPGPGGRVTVSAGGGSHPVWAPDSRTLYYRQAESFVRATLQLTPAPRVVSRTTALTGDVSRTSLATYDVMSDGRLLVLEPVPGSIRMVLVANWLEEFRARAR
jgi:serine/threonine protein kinase